MKLRKYLKTPNYLLYKYLPPMAYVKLASMIIPLIDSNRRHSKARFSKEGDLFKVTRGEHEYLFNSQFKVGRFLFPDRDFGSDVMNRYSDDDIFVENDDVVIDIGANIGEFSVAAARKARKVVALEPDQSAFRCAVENTRKSGNVDCLDVAVTERDGPVKFYVSSGMSDSSLLEPSEDYQETATVTGKTLHTIMRDHGIATVDFLKLEAEGYEPEILQGAASALRAVRKIAIDASPERYGQPTHEKCIEILSAAGFSVWRNGWIVFGRNPNVMPVELERP